MAINKENIKLLESQRLTDEGGRRQSLRQCGDRWTGETG